MKLKSLLHTLTGFALFMLMCVNPAAAQEGVGQVLMMQGKVLAYSESGDQRALKTGAAIYEGDTIETIGEGAATVTLADGTQWDIFDASKLSILEYLFTPEGSSRDSASFKVHEGQLTYTSGMLGQRGADVAIEMDDKTIYPEGTIISFFRSQQVSFVKTEKGNARVVEKTRQTTKITVGQWSIWGPEDQQMVASSDGEAITIIQRVITRTGMTVTPRGGVRINAKELVETVVKRGNEVISRSRTVTKTKTTTTVGSATGGSGYPAGLIPITTNSGPNFITTVPINGIPAGTIVTIDRGRLVPVSPN